MGEPALLAAVGVSRRYPRRGATWGRGKRAVTALEGVTLRVGAGESVAVVGPSGAGKSTLARLLAGLETPDEGYLAVSGTPINPASPHQLRRLRWTVQLVFQDPATSLNPRQRVLAAVREPLLVRGVGRHPATQRAGQLLQLVGLPASAEFGSRLPRELSGGERQRIALARALACEPQVLVLDEPTAALDASVRGQVVNLLWEMRRQRQVALVIVTHDLALAAALASRVVVLAAGRLVEEGEVAGVFARPQHAVTGAMVAAAAAQLGTWPRGPTLGADGVVSPLPPHG